MAEKTPTYTDNNGYKLASGFPLDGFRSGLEYEAKDEDLFIVTYPKVRPHCVFVITPSTSTDVFLPFT